MTDPLVFDLDIESSSINRARDTDVEVTTDPTGAGYIVAFEDSNDVHLVELTQDLDGWDGDCWMVNSDGDRTGRCRGYVHHDGPCAHLWAVRSHIAHQRLQDDDRRHSTDVDRVRADGGHHGRHR